VPVLGDGHGISTTKVDTTVNGATVDAIQIEGPWYRDIKGAEFLRPNAWGDAVKIFDDAQGLAFTITGDGDVIGSIQGAVGAHYMDINNYDIKGAAGGSGLHDLNMSGDVFSYGSGSHIGWIQDGDSIVGRTILTINSESLGGYDLGWQVGEDGDSFWKVGAELTLEGIAYRAPLGAPSDTDQVLGVTTASGVIQLAWEDGNGGTPGTLSATSTNTSGSPHYHAITGSLGLLGNGSAQWQVPVTGATPFTPVWTPLSAIPGAAQKPLMTDSSGHLALVRLQIVDAGSYICEAAANRLQVNGANFLDLAVAGTSRLRLQGSLLFPPTTDDLALGTEDYMFSDLWSTEANIGTVRAGIYYAESGTTYFLDLDSGATAMLTAGAIQCAKVQDVANTSYFLDPNATGISLEVAGSIRCAGAAYIHGDISGEGSSVSAIYGFSLGGSSSIAANVWVTLLHFGSYSSIGAETVTGFITASDSGGTTRKIAVVA